MTDSTNQIAAILTRASLEQYQNESPNRESTKTRSQGYPINLLDFETVLEYSTSKPAVHLYVKRFSIEWTYGRQRASLGKKMNNDSRVSNLLQAAFKKAKEIQAKRYSTSLPGGDHSGFAPIELQSNTSHQPLVSQNIFPDAGISQEAFASQVPAVCHPEVSNNRPTEKRQHLTHKSELLAHLGRQSKKPKGDTALNTSPMDQTVMSQSTQQIVSGSNEQVYRNIDNSKRAADTLASTDDSVHPPTLTPDIRLPNEVTSAGVRDLNSSAGPGLVAEAMVADRSTAVVLPGMNDRKPTSDHSNAETVDPDNIGSKGKEKVELTRQPDRPNPLDKLTLDYSDPWAGLQRIRSHDIRIPKDQKCLLEDKRCWVPPSPGMDMPHGHVPPLLLQGWNKSVLQRNRIAQPKESSHVVSEAPYAYEMPLTPSANSASDVDSEEASLPWSSSPVEHDARNQLPADSSPARTSHVPKEAKFPSLNENNAREIDSIDPVSNVTEGIRPEDEHVDKPDANLDDSPQASLQRTKVNALDSSIAHPQDPANESDSSNSDSPMDTSVPCPLLGSSQQAQQSSQPEQEITSSGPSLPGLIALEQIQVLETPAADLSRLRSNGVPNGDAGKDGRWDYDSSQQRSSQAANSSQSRIFNTYGSNDRAAVIGPAPYLDPNWSGPNGRPLEEVPDCSLEDEFVSNIHVMGTQISNENCLAQQAAPQSPSALVVDSSELMGHERSAPTSQTGPSQPSPPLSSNQEMPFSQLDEHGFCLHGRSQPRDPGSQNGTEDSGVPMLKRTAADIGYDNLSPSKRYKSAHHEGVHRDKSNESGNPNVDTAMLQGYISGSVNLDNALSIHGKFQRDYPSYTGNFAHFTELCSKLQALRVMGKLQRSFLWDDFVIMHLQEYPRYVEECSRTDTKVLAYEDYFTLNFSRPSYRRRSLVASAIDLCALHYVRPDQPSHPPRLPTAHDVDASTLEGRASHFHAHSLGTHTRNGHSNVNVHLESNAATSSYEDLDAAVVGRKPNAVEERSPGISCVPPTPSVDVANQEVKRDESLPNIPGPTTSSSQDTDMKMEEFQTAASGELDEETHDQGQGPPQEVPDNELGNSSEPESEPESINENWFVSLRHLRQSGPQWSDDRNTPFKAWARADQNVLSERLRRGGRYLAVDEHGVIQRTTTSHRQS